MKKRFEFFPHTADLKFKAWGEDLNKVFENSVLAVSSIITRNQKIKSIKKKDSEIQGRDYCELLYNLIDEIIYLLDAENFVVVRAKVEFKGERKIRVLFYGDDAKNYKNLDHVKAPTYSEMYVKNLGKNGWEIQAVVDV